MRRRVWRFRFAAAAARHVEEIVGWWREYRPRAPGLFAAELDQCRARLAKWPNLGSPYPHPAVAGLRRALLRTTRYHVYYSVDVVAGCIMIHATWHASRGSIPELG